MTGLWWYFGLGLWALAGLRVLSGISLETAFHKALRSSLVQG